MSLLSCAERDPVAARRQRFHVGRGFFLDGDDGDVVPQAARAFQRQQGEAAVSGDETVAHLT